MTEPAGSLRAVAWNTDLDAAPRDQLLALRTFDRVYAAEFTAGGWFVYGIGLNPAFVNPAWSLWPKSISTFSRKIDLGSLPIVTERSNWDALLRRDKTLDKALAAEKAKLAETARRVEELEAAQKALAAQVSLKRLLEDSHWLNRVGLAEYRRRAEQQRERAEHEMARAALSLVKLTDAKLAAFGELIEAALAETEVEK